MKDPSRVRVAGPLELYAAGFRVELARHGYTADSAVQRMQLMACLSRWMVVEEIAVGELTAERAERFTDWRRSAGYGHFRWVRLAFRDVILLVG